jgi:hypothetical protein
MRALAVLLLFACSAGDPLECTDPTGAAERSLTFELTSRPAAEPATRTQVQIWDAPWIADASATPAACLLTEGLPAQIEVGAPRLADGFMSSYATITVDLEGDGLGGCDLYGVEDGDLVSVPTSTGAHTIAAELKPSDGC